MAEEPRRADDDPIEAWDDEGGADAPADAEGSAHPKEPADASGSDEADEPAGAEASAGAAGADEDEAPADAERVKRWSDERTGHWHGAGSSDESQGRTGGK